MAKIKILIADDHRVVLKGIKGALQGHSEFEVVGEALNGRKAVELSESLKPDIVIMDIAMPELNGIDATMQIKKLFPDIQIIIYTMHSDREYIINLFKAGIAGYVLKDDPLSELLLAIKAVSGGGVYFTTKAPAVLLSHMADLEKGDIEKDGFKSLSLREREVVQLLAEGKTLKAIAETLCISPKTVESHKYSIMAKLGVKTQADLIKIAIRKNLTSV